LKQIKNTGKTNLLKQYNKIIQMVLECYSHFWLY